MKNFVLKSIVHTFSCSSSEFRQNEICFAAIIVPVSTSRAYGVRTLKMLYSRIVSATGRSKYLVGAGIKMEDDEREKYFKYF